MVLTAFNDAFSTFSTHKLYFGQQKEKTIYRGDK